MSTRAELFHGLKGGIFDGAQVEAEIVEKPTRAVWDPDHYAEEQIRGLVRRVFFPGWPRPARQVVFSAVDQGCDSAGICVQIARALEAQTPGTVCLVEANGEAPELANIFGGTTSDVPSAQERAGGSRKSPRQISDRLWFMPMEAFRGEGEAGLSAAWLHGRLGQLRLDFDYTLLHAAPAGRSSEAALLGQMSDGVILLLEANSTRRIAARQSRALLQTANARLLGTVLSQRTFPIPEGIYRRL